MTNSAQSSSGRSAKLAVNFSFKQYSNSLAVRRYNWSTTLSEVGSFLHISKTFWIDSLKLAFLLLIKYLLVKIITYSPDPFPLLKTPSASFICAIRVLSSSAIIYSI